MKVACIFAFCGACRSHELPTIGFGDIARYDDMYYVTVKQENTKTKKGKNSFAITPPLLDYVQRYESLRPTDAADRQEQVLRNAEENCYLPQFG